MLLSLWCTAQLSFTLETDVQKKPRPYCFCLGFILFPCPWWLAWEPQAALKSRGFLVHPAVPQLCAGRKVQHLHLWITKLRKQGGQRGLTLPLSGVLLLSLKLNILPQWDEIPRNFLALLRLCVLVMAFATSMTGEKIQARDAVLGLAIAATEVLKLLVHA